MRAILVMGLPASGKSAIVAPLAQQGYVVLNRDTVGGSVADLLPAFRGLLATSSPVVLDNLFLTAADRKPFIEAARALNTDLECHWMQTSFEDAQINALHRMYDRYGCVLTTATAIKEHPVANRDPNMFPVAAMFSARKRLEKPTIAEGFSKIVKVPFVRRPIPGHTNKALLLDYDGTLRRDAKELGGKNHYPVNLNEIEILPGRTRVLEDYQSRGYQLAGISTQSGIGKGAVTKEVVDLCFAETNKKLGVEIPVSYCPHHSFPVSCYCRKPQSGLGVAVIRDLKLDPAQCIYVGDLGTDRTFAGRLGFQFVEADTFFK